MLASCVVAATHQTPRYLFHKRGIAIYDCPDCGAIMADAEPRPAQYENEAYYTLAHESIAEIDDQWGFRWRRLAGAIARLRPGAELLDVGAGNGYFVAVARRDFGLRAEGWEPSATEAEFARKFLGVELQGLPLESCAGRFDAVTAFNVLEHVKDPHEFLATVLRCLRPGGIVALTTPNPGCIHRRLKGLDRWSMVCPPHHLNLFTRKALESLLESHGAIPLRYETLSTYIRRLRRYDTKGRLLRRLVFHLLRTTNLGADHLLISRATS